MKLVRDLTPLRAAAKAKVDAAAETARLAYVTPGSAQAMVYEQKFAEAQAFLADPTLTDAAAPHLYSEVGITAGTVAEVAGVIIAMRSLWLVKSSQIEAARLGAKAAIDAATSPAAIDAAAEVVWP